MRSFFRIPLFFLLIGSAIGLFFRFHFVFPVSWLNYGNWLHAHSHVMFLGWVINLLFLAFVFQFIEESDQTPFRRIYITLQILMLGLLVSFPLQGYGPFSITLLSLHILLGYYFCFLFYKRTRGRSEPSLWLAKASLFFFIFSSIGAFALGPIAASGMKQSPWYYYAILFYLHFQYNGMFVFGVFALFFHMLKSYGVEIREEYVNRMTLYLFVSCIPAYLLSVTWSDAGFILEGLAFLSAILQLVSLYWLLRGVWPVRWDIRSAVTKTSWILLNVVALSYVIKLILQGLSVIPAIARLASQVRYFLIGYLHLVLIGVVTFSLFIWLHERKLVKSLPVWLCWLMIVSFIVSEAIMVLIPLFGSFYQTWTQLLLVVSIVLFTGFSSYFFMFKSQSSTDIIFSSKPD